MQYMMHASLSQNDIYPLNGEKLNVRLILQVRHDYSSKIIVIMCVLRPIHARKLAHNATLLPQS
jgi:hypothetical protein